jgi:hypothetical protein
MVRFEDGGWRVLADAINEVRDGRGAGVVAVEELGAHADLSLCGRRHCQHPEHISAQQRRVGYRHPMCGICGMEGHRPSVCRDRMDP